MVKILAFVAKWCGPCRAGKPYLEMIGQTIPVSYYDADDGEDHSEFFAYSVATVPTYVVRDDEKILFQTHNVLELEKWVNALRDTES